MLPRLLELERGAVSQIEQQARVGLGRVPEIGAPVAAVRREALAAVGGWENTGSECLELGYRLARNGWEIVYQNRAECYENVPEEWSAYLSEIEQRARGRNQVLASHPWSAGLDGFLRLARPWFSVFLLVAWAVALVGSYTGDPVAVVSLAVLTLALYAGAGNCAGFFATAAAARLSRMNRLRAVTLVASCGDMILIATMRCSFWSNARSTTPNAPRPTTSCTS